MSRLNTLTILTFGINGAWILALAGVFFAGRLFPADAMPDPENLRYAAISLQGPANTLLGFWVKGRQDGERAEVQIEQARLRMPNE